MLQCEDKNIKDLLVGLLYRCWYVLYSLQRHDDRIKGTRQLLVSSEVHHPSTGSRQSFCCKYCQFLQKRAGRMSYEALPASRPSTRLHPPHAADAHLPGNQPARNYVYERSSLMPVPYPRHYKKAVGCCWRVTPARSRRTRRSLHRFRGNRRGTDGYGTGLCR